MELLYFALFLLAAGLILWGLNYILKKLAYPIEQRYLHCRILPVVLIALLACTNVYTISYPLQWLDSIINSPSLSYLFSRILPNRAYELVYMLLVHLGLNIMVMLFVIAVVILTKLLFSRFPGFVDIRDHYGIGKLLHLPWMIASLFYTEEEGNVRLNGRGFTMGIWVKGLKWVFGGLWIDTGFLDLNLCAANATRNIYGYLACNRGTNFVSGGLLVNNLGAPIQVSMDCVNILELNIRRCELGSQPVEAARLLALLIKDFAKTLFPVELSDGRRM